MTARNGIPCRFFPAGICRNGADCKYLHLSSSQISALQSLTGSSLKQDLVSTKYPCRFFMDKGCVNGDNCKFSHDVSLKSSSIAESPEEEEACSICFEKPSMFGLLLDCNHSFCLKCVRTWRKSKSSVDPYDTAIKTSLLCPMCRTSSKFVVPSPVGFPKGGEGKKKIVQLYLERLAATNCRYFMNSSTKQRFCPFGDGCLYKHPGDNGTERYVFGPLFHVKLLGRRRRRRLIGSPGDEEGAFSDLDEIIAAQNEWIGAEHDDYSETYTQMPPVETDTDSLPGDLQELDIMFSNMSSNDWLVHQANPYAFDHAYELSASQDSFETPLSDYDFYG